MYAQLLMNWVGGERFGQNLREAQVHVLLRMHYASV